jgi:hypothetical protein
MKTTVVNLAHDEEPTVNPLSAVQRLPRVAAMVMVMVRRVRARGAVPAEWFPGKAGAAEMGLAPAV